MTTKIIDSKKSLNLFIFLLPDSIQNIIFYYLTLHPVAELFKKDLSLYTNDLFKEDLKKAIKYKELIKASQNNNNID